MAELKPKLQLSHGYDLDLIQTSRLLQWLEQNERWNNLRACDDLGLSRIATKSIAELARAMGFTLPRSGQLTRLGEVTRTADPYLTNRAIPWIVHYNLSADPFHLVWHRMANQVLRPNVRLSLQGVRDCFADLHESRSTNSARVHLLQELSVFFNAYTDGALSSIAYVEKQDDAYMTPSAMRVPPPVFGYSLLAYASQYRPGETAVAIDEIAGAPSSPGRIFLMREPDVRAHLERMHRNDVICIENKGHLDQVRFVNPPDPADYLLAHFEDTED